MENGKVKTTEKKPSFSQKFSLFYNKNILPKLEPIEQDRKKCLCLSVLILVSDLYSVLTIIDTLKLEQNIGL